MNKVKTIFYFAYTMLFYRPFFRTAGKKIIICRPILITPRCLKVGSYLFIRDFARLEGVFRYADVSFDPLIEIGDQVSIEQNFHLTCAKSVKIGKGTAIAANVTITDIVHPYEDIRFSPEVQLIKTDEVTIGENCKLYNNVVILPGTKLGNHNIIGANSVVTGIFPDYCVIAGSPARIVKKYNVERQMWTKDDK
jgi:acetyltransferase-like isoleucine patch superfamily enzyme